MYIDGQESVNVQTSPDVAPATSSSQLPIPKDMLIYGGVGFVIFIIIYFLFF